MFELSEHLWWISGLILNVIFPLLPSCWGFSFALGCGVSFFGGIQHSPVDGCLAASCSFGVLTGEDEHTSFYPPSHIKTFLSGQCKEIEESNRMGKTRDLVKKIGDTKGTFHAKMGTINDRNGMDLTEAEDIKKRWQEYRRTIQKISSRPR